MKPKAKIKIKLNFYFCFHFVFHLRFCFCFCFLKVFAFLLTPRDLEVPQTVNCLLIGLEVATAFLLTNVAQSCHRRSTVSYLAQKYHSIFFFFCKFCTWPSGAINVQLPLNWPRSAIAPRNMAPSLIRICRTQ